MGLEAECELTTAGETVRVKALLESRALILRGAVKKTLPLGEISDPRVAGRQLLFEHHGLPYALGLPDGQAAKWLKTLTTEPPSLAARLGIDSAHKALVQGHADDPALIAALAGAVTENPAEAVLSVAIAGDPDALAGALNVLLHALPHAPIWIVYPKGSQKNAGSSLSESAVRNHLRSLGLIDTKVSSVSDRLTAIRFNRPKRNQL